MRSRLKYFVAGFALCILAIVLLLFWPQRQPPPLPFNTNAFISSKTLNTVSIPFNPTLADRATYFFVRMMEKIEGPGEWSFPAAPMTNWVVQPLLDDCMSVSGTRYLVPAEIAAGIVQFGHTNTLDGPQMIATAESALQHSDTGWWDVSAKKWRTERLILLRFPAQKTVVLIPKSDVTNFLRTNGIDPHRFIDDRR